ncbi:MAG: hypothetical protein QNJ42_09350 [Crocosphaera sp.]|nr:hypothetical protein [Crocosphaera sp.]
MNTLVFGWKRLTAASIITLLSSIGITTIALASSDTTIAQGEMISEEECPNQQEYIRERQEKYLEDYKEKIEEYQKKQNSLQQRSSQEKEYDKKIKDYKEKIEEYQKKQNSLQQGSPDEVNLVWKEICENEEADLSEKKIPAELLRTILLEEPFQEFLPTKVTIKNAIITGELDLSAEEIQQQLHLESSTFQEKVNLTESKFLQSLYFDGSTFEKSLDMKSAIFERSLYIRGATFENAENNTLNLSKARIDGTLSLSTTDPMNSDSTNNEGTRFNFNFKTAQQGSDQRIRIVNLQLAEIKQALDIRKLQVCRDDSFSHNDQYDSVYPCQKYKIKSKEEEKSKPEFFARSSKIGDAIIIDGDTGFDKLDFQNSKANMLVFAISSKTEDKLDDIEIDNILHSFNDNILHRLIDQILNIFNKRNVSKLETKLTELSDTSYLLQQKVNLREVELNKITVYARKDKDKDIYKFTTYDRKDKDKVTFTTGNQDDQKDESCHIELDGLVSTTIDPLAAKFFLICLRQHYRYVTDEKINQDIKERIKKFKKAKAEQIKDEIDQVIKGQYVRLSSLIQPLENAARMAKMLGKEKVSTRMSYQRKSLDVHIATIDIFNKRHQCMDFNESLCFAVFERLNHGWLSLLNVFYGFGYYRMQALWWVLGLFFVGIYFAQKEMSKKQKSIISDAILDSVNYTVKNCSESAMVKKFEELEPDLEFFANIEAIIFDYSNYQDSEKFDFLIKKKGKKKKNSSNNYLKIILYNKKNLKWFIDRLETYNPDAKKMGFCHNFYGKNSLYLVIPKQPTREKLNVSQFDLEKIKNIQEDLDSETIKKFTLFWIKEGQKIILPTYLTNVWRSSIYSFDNMFPIIELDKELQQFIFENSEKVTRFALQVQQIAAKIILFILLPILFF